MGELESFGDSSTENNEKALNAIADLVKDILPGSMTQKFVLIVETIDEEDRKLYCYTAPGQKIWDTLGILAFANGVEEI